MRLIKKRFAVFAQQKGNVKEQEKRGNYYLIFFIFKGIYTILCIALCCELSKKNKFGLVQVCFFFNTQMNVERVTVHQHKSDVFREAFTHTNAFLDVNL